MLAAGRRVLDETRLATERGNMVVVDRPDRVVWDNLVQTNVGIFGNDHRMIGDAWRCC